MRSVKLWIGTLRLWVLPLTLPYALMWASVEGSGGAWMVAAHSALVLMYFLSLDQTFLREQLDPRMGLLRDRFVASASLIGAVRAASVVVSLVCAAVLLFIEFDLALVAFIAAALIALRVSSATRREGVRRFVLGELTLPLAAIIFPALVIGADQWGRELDAQQGDRIASATATVSPASMGADILGSSVLGALLLGSFALLCLIRDEAHDRAQGLRTSATLFGRDGAALAQMVWLALSVVVAVYGVGAGWWPGFGWLVAAFVGVASLVSVWSLARHDVRRAVGVWYLASSAASIVMAWSILAPPAPTSSARAPASEAQVEDAQPALPN